MRIAGLLGTTGPGFGLSVQQAGMPWPVSSLRPQRTTASGGVRLRGQETPGVSWKGSLAAQIPSFLASTLAKGLWGWAGEVAANASAGVHPYHGVLVVDFDNNDRGIIPQLMSFTIELQVVEYQHLVPGGAQGLIQYLQQGGVDR